MTSESDLREKNIGSLFDLFDVDQDGYITEDDLLAAAGKALDGFGITDVQLRADILGIYRPAWEQLRADCDSNGDGRITRHELAAAFIAGLSDPRAYYQQVFGPIVDRFAQVADQDGDGFIEADEYARLFTSPRMDQHAVRAAFERLDADADGKISIGEFTGAFAQMFLSRDPADPGTTVMGHS